MEISRSQTLRNNERLKHFASTMTAWANALVIGGFGTTIAGLEIQFGPALAILTGFVMMWMCSILLTMLQKVKYEHL